MALETAWLPDFIYTGNRFHSNLAMFADSTGRITRFSRDPADLERAQRLPNRAILPGLVNVHSHTFQRLIRGRTEYRTSHRDTFWTWRESMYRAANLVTPEMLYRAARMAFLEMALSGITTVGEFHYVHHQPGGVPYANRNQLALLILRAAEEIGIRIALLRTAYVRAGFNKPADPGQIRFITANVDDFLRDTGDLASAIKTASNASTDSSKRAWVAVAPHSIRAVPLDYLREVAAYARANDLPLHMHVAEQPGEIEQCLAEYACRPVELLHREALLNPRFTAIHAIHITPEEARLLGSARQSGATRDSQPGTARPSAAEGGSPAADESGTAHHLRSAGESPNDSAASGANVCACPTSERNLGDGAVPADQLYAAGASICFGSDSNIQIDILEDARELEYHLRMKRLERVILSESDTLSARLFSSATASGARSLDAPSGSLEPGKPADFFTIDLNDPSLAGAEHAGLLDTIVFALERTAIRDVFVAGARIINDGRHALQDEIVAEFSSAQRELWS